MEAPRSEEFAKYQGGRETKIACLYRRAVLKSIEDLHDFQSRSNVDLIRRRAQSIIGDDDWNDKLFFKTLKSAVCLGQVQQDQALLELSPEFKKKRAYSIEQHIFPEHHLLPVEVKTPPVRVPERAKWKVQPKYATDGITLVNPMDTW